MTTLPVKEMAKARLQFFEEACLRSVPVSVKHSPAHYLELATEAPLADGSALTVSCRINNKDEVILTPAARVVLFNLLQHYKELMDAHYKTSVSLVTNGGK